MEETKRLAEFVYKTNYESLPDEIITRAKTVMLDTLSCAVAGYTAAEEECKWIIDFVSELGGVEESTVWLNGYRTNAMNAAMANSTMAHTVDFDDTHIDSISHLGAGLLGTVISLGEKLESSGKDVLTAFVLGFEVGGRAGNSVNKGTLSHYKYWHPTATGSTIGCAAAAAKLYGLSADQIEQAIGLGIDQAAGFRYCIDKGDYSKSLHPGWASQRGIMAAQIIKLGANGPKGLFEYKTGFCNAMSEQPNLRELIDGLGTDYAILSDALKMYPTIHCSHTGIEGVLTLVNDNKIDAEDIESIYLRMTEFAKNQGVNYKPKGVLEARLSIPCCLSIAARKKQLTLNDFVLEDILSNDNIEFMQKIIIQPEPEFNKQYPDALAGEVTIITKDKREYKIFNAYPKGHPKRLASPKDVKAKYDMLTGLTWSEKNAQAVYENFNRIEEIDNIDTIISLLGRVQPI